MYFPSKHLKDIPSDELTANRADLEAMMEGSVPMRLPRSDEKTGMHAYKVTKRGKLRISPEQQELLNEAFFHDHGWSLSVSRLDKRDHVSLCAYANNNNNGSQLDTTLVDSHLIGIARIENLGIRAGCLQEFLHLLDLPGTIGHDAVSAFNTKMQHDLGEVLSRRQRTLAPRSNGRSYSLANLVHGDEYERCFYEACGDASEISGCELESNGSVFGEDSDDMETCESDDDKDSDCSNSEFD